MSLLDWIERMREEPEPVRRRVTLLIASLLTGIIVLVWVAVSLITFSSSRDFTLPEDYAPSSPTKEVSGVLTQFKEGTYEQFKALEKNVSLFKGLFLNAQESSE